MTAPSSPSSRRRHRLWLGLSAALCDGSDALELLIRRMLYADISVSPGTAVPEAFRTTFPSDAAWQNKIYLQLVERQRRHDEAAAQGEGMPSDQQKLHDWNILPRKRKKPLVPQICRPDCQRRTSSTDPVGRGVTWTVNDLAKAGCLLTTPPRDVEFEDEQEMRVVYSLIYDVYRYKTILNQALDDVSFFQHHRHLQQCAPKVRLLAYDLHQRGFKKRDTRTAELARAVFEEVGLSEVEEALWAHRVRLAAAIARLRIKNSALSLHDLLPRHLRDRTATRRPGEVPVACWINVAKVKNVNEIREEILKTLHIRNLDQNDTLLPNTFKFDKVCPLFVIFHSSLRTLVTQSHLVQNDKLIVQDKSFCLGPAAFGKVVSDLELTGHVVQSHVNSPRTTAYLASILSQNTKIKKLMAFSAGHRKQEYERYFQKLGMKNIVLHSNRLVDSPPDAAYLEEVVAVLATPPNSYSAVSDPVDLVCGRGGDLSMLEVLTESEETNEGRKRVASILEEQKLTLQFAMSRPQIQVVLYETHSELKAENDDMVQSTVSEINKIAKIHHASLQGKLILPSVTGTENTEINNNESIIKIDNNSDESTENSAVDLMAKTLSMMSKNQSCESDSTDDYYFKDVVVPETDIFENPKLPDLCPNEDGCLNLSKEGCFLSLVQRKQVIRIDNKYMIQMAEKRGLFGDESSTSGKSKSTKNPKKKMEKDPLPKSKKKMKTIEIDRIAAPTQSSCLRAHQPPPSFHRCPRHQEAAGDDDVGKVGRAARRWWSETAHHLRALRSSVARRAGGVGDSPEVAVTVDEVVCRDRERVGMRGDAVPMFPRLRLSRPRKGRSQVRVPMAVTVLEFPVKERKRRV